MGLGDLPDELRQAGAEPDQTGASLVGQTLEEVEVKLIRETLQCTGGNVAEAAECLGLHDSRWTAPE
ncbi:MAG: helix-turn-helix domain-containing protein [Bacillota bacterium]